MPRHEVIEYDWECEAGRDFLRVVLAAKIAGLDVAQIGRELDVERLEFVLMAREKDLLS